MYYIFQNREILLKNGLVAQVRKSLFRCSSLVITNTRTVVARPLCMMYSSRSIVYSSFNAAEGLGFDTRRVQLFVPL